MASKIPTLDPMTQKPTQKREITKDFMLAYLESELATAEDVKWYIELTNDPANRKMYKSKLSGTEYEDIIKKNVVDAFCKRFYPHLLEKNSSKPKFEDKLQRILNKKLSK